MKPFLARCFASSLEIAQGWDHRPALRLLERLECAPREEVQEYRRERLRELLTHVAETVPYYRRIFAQKGIDPRKLAESGDLSPLPIVDKAILRARYDEFQSEDRSLRTAVWTSSGSTGEPFSFRIDRASIAANTFASLARGRRWWNLEPGAPEVMIWSGARDVSGTWAGRWAAMRRRIAWRLRNILLVDVYGIDDAAIRDSFHRMVRFRPRLIRAIASGLLRFCTGVDASGLAGTRLGLEAVIFTGEGLSPGQRELIERVLGCPTVAEYGCTELGIIAFECPRRRLHLNHENLFVEYLSDAGPAELLVTNLNGRAAPLIRYRVGDLVLPSAERCPCGRALPLLGAVQGRTNDVIVTRAGGVVHCLFFTHLFDRLPSVERFRVVQEDLDRLRVELWSSREIPESHRRKVEAAVFREMGHGVRVEVLQVRELPIGPGGKSPWIVSNVSASRSC
jgi:phenylacetate-CoA ligase